MFSPFVGYKSIKNYGEHAQTESLKCVSTANTGLVHPQGKNTKYIHQAKEAITA